MAWRPKPHGQSRISAPGSTPARATAASASLAVRSSFVHGQVRPQVRLVEDGVPIAHLRQTPAHARPPRLPLRVPDSRAYDVPREPHARADAAAGGRAPRRVRADVGRARDPLVGRGLVGVADDGRRPDRAHRRRAGGLDRDAAERRHRRGDRALVLPAGRSRRGTASSTSARTSRPCATSTRRSPTSRSSCARTTRRSSSGSTSARSSSRSAMSSSRSRRSRTSSRSCGARTRSART